VSQKRVILSIQAKKRAKEVQPIKKNANFAPLYVRKYARELDK
jgi:hypothetical protein